MFFFCFFFYPSGGGCAAAPRNHLGESRGWGWEGGRRKKGMEGMKIGLWGVWGDAALHHPVHLPVLYQQIGLHGLEAVL